MGRKNSTELVNGFEQRKTELSYERTILAYARTFAAFTLFGVALISFSDRYGRSLLFIGSAAIAAGFVLGIFALRSYLRHRKKWAEMGLNR